MQDKKILYVWQSSYPWEVRVQKITEALVKAGAQVSILCRKKTEIKSSAEIKIFDFGDSSFSAPAPFSPVWTKRMKEIIQTEKIDLIIARDILVSPSAIRAAKSFDIPVLIDMAEHYPAAMKGWKKYRKGFLNRLMVHQLDATAYVEKYSVLKANGVITVCLEQEQRLMKLGARADNLCSVYNTPELSNFPKPPIKKQPPLKKFAHHGFLTPERGLDTLIKAFSILKKSGHDLELTIAGSGECEFELQRLATEVHAPVHFTGRYPFSEFPKLLSEIDVGILPYQLSEFLDHTVANKLFDYMAAGKPVLVSNTKSLSRIVHETNAGAVVDVRSAQQLADSIVSFINLATGHEGFRGRQAIEAKYNWEHDAATLVHFVGRYL
ncbi:MAG: glycosyltransferase [Bdellovibrio sp.]|nr:glycosyltransferase [Bdellovibrio sp.]